MAFTEFYCDAATGSNINAGDNKTVVTSTNGDWGNAAANRFTAAAGTPFSGVSVGDFASVYLDGATLAVYIARVTAVNSGGASLDLSTTAKSGTAPATGATGRTCTTGGAWKGPNGTVNFPFGFLTGAVNNVAGDPVRCNLKNGTSYAITAAVAHQSSGGMQYFQGYTTTAGDLGKAIIDGGTAGTSFVLFTINTTAAAGSNVALCDLILQNNGSTGTSDGLAITSVSTWEHIEVNRVVVNNVRGDGILVSVGATFLNECEVYAANQANTVGDVGIKITVGCSLNRCISHDNTGSNNSGACVPTSTGIITFDKCIFESNGLYGLRLDSWICTHVVKNCDFYNNGNDGIHILNTSSFLGTEYIENCNFIKNGGYGIKLESGIANSNVSAINCGFGAGTQVNTSGSMNGMGASIIVGSATYANDVTPWVDPANGDFRINLAAAKGAGRGAFTETAASYAGTVGYPDIGAAQHQDSASGGGGMPPIYDGVRDP